MSTAARKARKRRRHAALAAGETALAELLRFQHPRKTPTPWSASLPVSFDGDGAGTLWRRLFRAFGGR